MEIVRGRPERAEMFFFDRGSSLIFIAITTQRIRVHRNTIGNAYLFVVPVFIFSVLRQTRTHSPYSHRLYYPNACMPLHETPARAAPGAQNYCV